MMLFTFQLRGFAPIGCLGGTLHPAPIQHHLRVPQGRGASHQGCSGLEALDGHHQSNGRPWEPAVHEQQTRLVWASTPLSLLELRPRQLPAAGP